MSSQLSNRKSILANCVISCCLVVLLSNSALAQTEIVVPAGEYEIVANLSLPHVQNNLGANSKQISCLGQQQADDLFPILEHPSFTDCVLIRDNRVKNNNTIFQLNCDNKYAATGKAYFYVEQNQFSAQLDIKMGAKNMTMTQRIKAIRVAPCQPQ